MLKSNPNTREDIVSAYEVLNNSMWGLAYKLGMLGNSVIME